MHLCILSDFQNRAPVGVAAVCLTHLWDFLPSVPPGPEPQSWAWMMKVYSFCSSQSTRPRALSWPSPDVPFSTTASNGASSPWMLNAQISPRDQEEGRERGEEEGEDVSVNHIQSGGMQVANKCVWVSWQVWETIATLFWDFGLFCFHYMSDCGNLYPDLLPCFPTKHGEDVFFMAMEKKVIQMIKRCYFFPPQQNIWPRRVNRLKQEFSSDDFSRNPCQ